MAREKLRRMGRFELLQLIFAMKKSNEELTLRCRDAEKQLDTLKRETSQREDRIRREFEQRIDELRMQGSAKDLQVRVKKIEQQIHEIQLLTEKEGFGAEESADGAPGQERADGAPQADPANPEPTPSQQGGE
ncbi:MAG: hypothetical protein IKH57_10985 [Clostridia bacterium]|nr:hypothetical protein [Clostridia bacterium]